VQNTVNCTTNAHHTHSCTCLNTIVLPSICSGMLKYIGGIFKFPTAACVTLPAANIVEAQGLLLHPYAQRPSMLCICRLPLCCLYLCLLSAACSYIFSGPPSTIGDISSLFHYGPYHCISCKHRASTGPAAIPICSGALNVVFLPLPSPLQRL
jgi:hypothetical protein